MNTLHWNHTRTGKPMTMQGPHGVLLMRVMMIRGRFPNHPMTLNNQPV